jgi:membrane-associated phospholipid phosphatase
MDILIRVVADGLVVLVVLVAGLTFVSSVKNDKYQQYVRAIMAGLTALTIAKIMSLLYQTGTRPFQEMGVEPKAAYLDNPGFPSDHALLVFTLAFIVIAATKNKTVGLIILGMSLLIGIGRVIALVHSPADVIGSILAALLGVGVWYGSSWRKNY